MFADYHVHTYYSDDSEYPMEEVPESRSACPWRTWIIPATRPRSRL